MRRETMTMMVRGIQMLTTTSSALFPAFLHIFTLILLCRFLWIRWKLWAKTLLSPWYAICKPKDGSLDGRSSNWCHRLTLNETLIKRWRLLPRFPSELIIIIAPRAPSTYYLHQREGNWAGWGRTAGGWGRLGKWDESILWVLLLWAPCPRDPDITQHWSKSLLEEPLPDLIFKDITMQQTNIKVATYVPSSPRRGIWAPMIAQTQTKAQFRQEINLGGIRGEIIIIIPAPPAWSVPPTQGGWDPGRKWGTRRGRLVGHLKDWSWYVCGSCWWWW